MSIRGVWHRITEPRHLKVAMLVIYSIATFTGVVTFLMPPLSVEAVIGHVTYLWSALVLAGGVGGMITVLPGWWAFERLSILALWTGIAIYAVVLLFLHFVEAGSRLTQLGFLLLSAGVFYIRRFTIRTYSFDPHADRG